MQAFLELWKINSTIKQDVSLYIQTFQVVHPKTLLPFLQNGEKTSELVFFLVNHLVDSNLFFFNLQKIPASSRLFLFSPPPTNTIVFNVLMLQICRRKLSQKQKWK